MSDLSSDIICDLPEWPRAYIYYHKSDEDYALKIASVMSQSDVLALLPVFDGGVLDVKEWHHLQLAQCDAVVMCWANAAELWVQVNAGELTDWRKLGRDRDFSCRALILGPPQVAGKERIVAFPPRGVDLVLDLTGYETPSPELLRPLMDAIHRKVN